MSDASGLSLFTLMISARTRFLSPRYLSNRENLTYHGPAVQGDTNQATQDLKIAGARWLTQLCRDHTGTKRATTKPQGSPGNAYHSGETILIVKKAAPPTRPGAHDRLRRIEGRHNALVKELRRAFTHSELTADGECAIEGLRMVEEAIRSGLKFRAVFFSESAGNKADRLLPQIGSHAETLLLPDELFASAVPTETPQGVAALVKLKTYQLQDVISRAPAGPLLAVAGVQDPGNLGTILRSAEAFGAAGVILGEGTVSPYNSKVIR